MESWLDLLILVVLFVINGMFSMVEVALVTSRRAKIQAMADGGNKGAAAGLKLIDDPNWALSTIQVGITSIGILSGIVGESALATPVVHVLADWGLPADTAKLIAIVFVVVAITYFSIVIGELVPKRIGQMNPEGMLCSFARFMQLLSLIMSPFVKLLSVSTEKLLKLLRIRDSKSGVTEEEIHAIIDEGSASGAIEVNERDMVRNVFRLDDRQVGSLMTPRSDIEWVNLKENRDTSIQKILSSHRARLVVADESLDNVKGVCTTRQLLREMIQNGKPDFKDLTPVAYVPESLSGMELLEHFKNTDIPLSLVVDEYGEVVGLVTPRDLLEAIAGEFKPETTGDAWAVSRGDGSWYLDGLIPIPELKDRLGFKHVPEEELGRYNTLSGMMMLLLGRMPKTGDKAMWEGWQLEVADMDGRRIDKVLAIPLKKSALTNSKKNGSTAK